MPNPVDDILAQERALALGSATNRPPAASSPVDDVLAEERALALSSKGLGPTRAVTPQPQKPGQTSIPFLEGFAEGFGESLPVQAAKAMASAFGRVVGTAVDLPTHAANWVRGKRPGMYGYVEPIGDRPVLYPPNFDQPSNFLEGLWNSVASQATEMSAPSQAAMFALPFGGVAGKLIFAPTMGDAALHAVPPMLRAAGEKGLLAPETGAAFGNAAVPVGMLGMMAHRGKTPAENEQAAAAALEKGIQRYIDDAVARRVAEGPVRIKGQPPVTPIPAAAPVPVPAVPPVAPSPMPVQAEKAPVGQAVSADKPLAAPIGDMATAPAVGPVAFNPPKVDALEAETIARVSEQERIAQEEAAAKPTAEQQKQEARQQREVERGRPDVQPPQPQPAAPLPQPVGPVVLQPEMPHPQQQQPPPQPPKKKQETEVTSDDVLHELKSASAALKTALDNHWLTSDEVGFYQRKGDEIAANIADPKAAMIKAKALRDSIQANGAIGMKEQEKAKQPVEQPSQFMSPQQPDSPLSWKEQWKQMSIEQHEEAMDKWKPRDKQTPEEQAVAKELFEQWADRMMKQPLGARPGYWVTKPMKGLDLPKAEGPRLLQDPQRLRLQQDKQGRYTRQELFNRLANTMHPDEWAVMKAQGIEQAFQGKEKVTGEEVAKWMEEKGPKVEVKKLEAQSARKTQQRAARIQHEILDRYRPDQEPNRAVELDGERHTVAEWNRIRDELEQQSVERGGHSESATARYQMVNPKPLDQMPGAVDLLVRVPVEHAKPGDVGRRIGKRPEDDYKESSVKYSSHHYPNEGKNLLAHVRGYMETLSNGKKVFRIFEAQSDWAQDRRRAIEQEVKDMEAHIGRPLREYTRLLSTDFPTDTVITQENIRSLAEAIQDKATDAVKDDPLLRHYERLALKAAIEHAKENGADYVAVDDAETAMMSEGHDRAAISVVEPNEHNLARAREIIAAGREGNQFWREAEKLLEGKRLEFDMRGNRVRQSGFEFKDEVSQEPGMRLHYDRTLPKIMQELTGKEGEKVEFGEHQNAVDEQYRYRQQESQQHGRDLMGQTTDKYRKNLIFRNPDGTPKTTSTARLYPIDKARTDFSLFGKDRAVRPLDLPPIARDLPAYDQATFEHLELGKPDTTLATVMDRIASAPERYGSEMAVIAKWLRDTFPNAEGVGMDPGRQEGAQRASFDPGGPTEMPKVYMDVAGEASQHIPLEYRALHEGTHALLFWQLEHPMTDTQVKAKATLERIMKESRVKLWDDDDLGYYHQDLHEFVAGIMDSTRMRQHLSSFKFGEGETWYQRAWNAICELLGVKKGSALEAALNTMQEIGQDRVQWEENKRAYYQDPVANAEHRVGMMAEKVLGQEGWEPEKPESPQAPPVKLPPPPVRDRALGERVAAARSSFARRTLPAHMAADKNTAEWLVRYASARIAAPEVARAKANEVLGGRWKDKAWDKLLGSVLVEDRLRGMKAEFNRLAAAQKDPIKQRELLDKAQDVVSIIGRESPIRTEAQYQALLADPEIKAAIQRHKDTVQNYAQHMHNALGGQNAAEGEQTAAFVNLAALLSDDVDTARAMMFGSTRGNILNPLKKKSAFSKQASGTAEKYELSYRTLAERMVRGNYERYALARYYEAAVAAGLAVEAQPGAAQETAKGVKLEKTTNLLRGSGPGMTMRRDFWLRPDLMEEYRQAVNTDTGWAKGLAGTIAAGLTEVQLAGPVDATWHTVNMLGVIAQSQGAGPWWYDAVRKAGGPVSVLDAVIRVGYEAMKVMAEDGEYHKLLNVLAPEGTGRRAALEEKGLESQARTARLSQIGAGRGVAEHRTPIANTLQRLGVSEETARKFDPQAYSQSFIRIVDRAGRVVLDKMYDNLVERGWLKDTPDGRREFVNQMGQYNSRLMPKFDRAVRELSISPFLVAGKNMNNAAMRRLFAMEPVAKEQQLAYWGMKTINTVGLLGTLFAVPMVFNTLNTGKPMGRPGVPFGAVDTGKDDKDGKPIVFDPLQMLLLRRGLRGTGGQSLMKGVDEKLTTKETGAAMFKDMFNFFIHPYTGPAVRAGYAFVTGREPQMGGYLTSKNPQSMSANAWASLKSLFPMLSKGMERKEEGGSFGKGMWESISGAVGMKKGRTPSFEEWVKQRTGKDYASLPIKEQRALANEHARLKKDEGQNIYAHRSAGEKDYWAGVQRQDDLMGALPKDQQQWLRDNKLTVPGYRDIRSVARVRVPLPKEQQDDKMALVTKEYAAAIQRLRQNPTFMRRWASLDTKRKQELLDSWLKVARQRAGVELRQEGRRP